MLINYRAVRLGPEVGQWGTFLWGVIGVPIIALIDRHTLRVKTFSNDPAKQFQQSFWQNAPPQLSLANFFDVIEQIVW